MRFIKENIAQCCLFASLVQAVASGASVPTQLRPGTAWRDSNGSGGVTKWVANNGDDAVIYYATGLTTVTSELIEPVIVHRYSRMLCTQAGMPVGCTLEAMPKTVQIGDFTVVTAVVNLGRKSIFFFIAASQYAQAQFMFAAADKEMFLKYEAVADVVYKAWWERDVGSAVRQAQANTSAGAGDALSTFITNSRTMDMLTRGALDRYRGKR